MKLIEKLGEVSYETEQDPGYGGYDANPYLRGFEAGFRKAREMATEIESRQNAYSVEYFAIKHLGEEEV